MIDYTLPVARRTRQGVERIHKEYCQGKKRKRDNGVDSASPSGLGKRKGLAKKVKSFSGSKRLGANCRTKTERETVAVSDSSVEEIDGNDWGEEGTDGAEKSVGLKINENSSTALERTNNVEEVVVDESEDELVVLGDGVGLDGPEIAEDVVCIDIDDDDDDVSSVKDVNESSHPNSDGRSSDKMVASMTRGENSCLNFDNGKSSGVPNRNEYGDGDDDAVWDDSDSSEGDGDSDDENAVLDKDEGDGNDISVDSIGSETSLESSSGDTDSDYDDSEGEKSESSSASEKLSSDGRVEEEVKEEHVEKKRITTRGRPKKVVGLKRRVCGLYVLVDTENGDNNVNGVKDSSANPRRQLSCVARRTRSHYTSKCRKKGLGTFSQPLCVDEEESKSSSGHDDTDDRGEAFSNKKKVGSDYGSEDNLSDDETCRAGKNTLSSWRKIEANRGYDDECGQKVHRRDEGKLRKAVKGKRIDLGKRCDSLKILVDSILEKGVPLEEMESFKDENNSALDKMPLPLKFCFGIEELSPPQKTEEEKEMDELWASFDLALRSSEIGSADSAKVEDEDALPPEDYVDGATLCQVGNHELILDEQVGLRCTFCSYVKMEMKYILPSFSTHPFGKSDRRDPGADMNHSSLDDLRFQDSGADSRSGCNLQAHAEATVWDIIPGIKSSMYPHQRDGFEFIWKNIAGGILLDKLKNQTTSDGSGCIISHAPGTGKTRLAIVFLQTYMKLNPTCRPVIVAPCSMLLTWEEEFRKWNFDIPFHNLNKRKLSGKESMVAYNWLSQAGNLDETAIRMLKLYSWKMCSSILGISYKLFGSLTGTKRTQFRKILLEIPGLVVLDEGHIPRNFDSILLKALSNIRTDKRIILSGTPFQNNFDELYNTLCLARPKFKLIRRKWEYLTSSIAKGADDRLKREKLKKVRDMIDPFVHVHKGSILLEKLPGLKDTVVILQPAQLQKGLFDELCLYGTKYHFNHFKCDYYESLISVHPSLMRNCGEEEFPSERVKMKKFNLEDGVKIQFLVELIRLSEATNEKVLVFSQYIEPLAFIMDQLKSHFNWTEGNEVLYMDGKINVKHRQSSISVFNDPTSEARVLLASTRACCEGINLVGASRVVLLDVLWNPSVERQAISRAHRLGQERVVYIYHLIASGTNEGEKYCRQVQKDLFSELVFSSSGRSEHRQKALVSEDKLLEEMVQHEKLRDIFVKIQQRESKLIETFTLLEKNPII